jgi:hypothetical protein
VTPKQLRACQDLELGRRQPTTLAQEQFLKVCGGEFHPVTEYEIEYLKWRSKKVDEEQRLASQDVAAAQDGERWTQRQRASVEKPSTKQMQIAERERLDLKRKKEFLAGPTRVAEEWGSRDDWKRDSGSWRR